MKRSRIACAALILMTASILAAGAADADKYAVKAPIKIQWWHAMEAQYRPLIDKVVADFEKQNPMIDVEAIYQGSYADLNEKLIAAQAAGTTLPALCVANTPYVAGYGDSGLCENLDPYIAATGFDIKDFGAGLRVASSFGGKQVSLPFLISTQIMFYNKTMADAEKIKLPETWADMDEFMKKASKVSGGTTQRYATVIPGWDQWYFEPFYLNAGVKIVNDDKKTTDLGSAKAIDIAKKLKAWCDEKRTYWAYGKDASGIMRQNFIDGKAFSIIHTTSLYNLYESSCKFEVGMHYLPGNVSRDSEIGGCVLLIPSKNKQEVKNAAWKLLSYLTGKDVNMLWARETGYMPTRNSVLDTSEAKDYLAKKPAFKPVFTFLDNINPRIQHPAYTALAKLWMQEMAKVIIEGGDVTQSMQKMAKLIDEALQD
jgi:multiple sugar transport system substrate-binding protein